MSLQVYKVAFGQSLQRQFTYRVDFLFTKFRDLIVFSSLLFLSQAVPSGIGSFSQAELQAYIFIAAMISNVVFMLDAEKMAQEIAEGDVVKYLLKPLSFFWFWSATSLARRMMYLITGVMFVVILKLFFSSALFFIQSKASAWVWFGIFFSGSLLISQLLSFLGSSIAFWIVRSHGVRWVMVVLIQFFSGLLMPLDAFPAWIKTVTNLTPFPFMVSVPINAYLGRLSGQAAWTSSVVLCAWIALLSALSYFVWQKGLKKYDAYGR